MLGALLDAPQNLVDRLKSSDHWNAPHLLDVEFLNSLRRLVLAGLVTSERAAYARADMADLTIERFPHEPFADRIWELRRNLTAYDAAYVALAEGLRAPLITCDAGPAAAPGIQTSVELFATSGGSPTGSRISPARPRSRSTGTDA